MIDGWGIASGPNQPGDAISAAATPVMDGFRSAAGYTELAASSLAVGLPEGLMGNSEVGHLNIGAGRVVWQDVVRIDQTAKEGRFPATPNLQASLQHAKDTNGRLHLLGLVSDGGVHSKNEHLYELLRSAKQLAVPHVYIHFFGDGRDTDPKSAARYMQELLDKIAELGMDGVAKVATVVGRFVFSLASSDPMLTPVWQILCHGPRQEVGSCAVGPQGPRQWRGRAHQRPCGQDPGEVRPERDGRVP